MGDFGLEVGGEVDDSNGFEWAPGLCRVGIGG